MEKTDVFYIWSMSLMDCYSTSKMEPYASTTCSFVKKHILLVGPTCPHEPYRLILIDCKRRSIHSYMHSNLCSEMGWRGPEGCTIWTTLSSPMSSLSDERLSLSGAARMKPLDKGCLKKYRLCTLTSNSRCQKTTRILFMLLDLPSAYQSINP